MGKEVKNSLGEILKDKEYVYWYVISNMGYELMFRIEKHRMFIKKHKHAIIDNVNFANIITDEIKNINERKAKIEELKELMRKEYGEKAIDF